MRPGWGCKEEARRLAGPGLGDAVVERTSTKTEGRSPPRHADPIVTTEGGGWAWLARRGFPWRPPDKQPFPPVLVLRLITITIRRREESSPLDPAWLLSIGITPEEEGGLRAEGLVVRGGTMMAVTVKRDWVVGAVATSSRTPPPLAPPPFVMGKVRSSPTTPSATEEQEG
jgi:hypothetical protein